MKKRSVLLSFIFLFTLFSAPFASAEKVWKFAVTDVQGFEELQREFKAFEDDLSKFTGMKFKLFPVSGRTSVVEALRAKKLDFALSGPAEYVIISKKTQSVPVVGLRRQGYYSVIVTMKNSGITSFEDLKGEKVAFGDIGSTAYHLAPMKILNDNGINPTKDIRPIHINKNVAWKSLIKGDVAAFGMNQDRFHRFSALEKDLSEKDFNLLARGEDLPSDLIMAGSHVPEDARLKMRDAFAKHGKLLLTAMLQGVRNQKYQGMEFYTEIVDGDYDSVRQMYAIAGIEGFSDKAKG